jgi:hypothetical protein
MIPKGYLPISTAEGRMFFYPDKRGRIDYEITAGNLPVYYFNGERRALVVLSPAEWSKVNKIKAFGSGTISLEKGKDVTLLVEQSEFEKLLSAEIAQSEAFMLGPKTELMPQAGSDPALKTRSETGGESSTGRTPEYVWDKIWAETVYYIDQNGLPKDQESLIGIIQDLCRDKLNMKEIRRSKSKSSDVPSRTTLQPKVKAVFAVFKREANAR